MIVYGLNLSKTAALDTFIIHYMYNVMYSHLCMVGGYSQGGGGGQPGSKGVTP